MQTNSQRQQALLQRRALQRLADIRGDGTSLITLLVPGKEPVHRVVQVIKTYAQPLFKVLSPCLLTFDLSNM